MLASQARAWSDRLAATHVLAHHDALFVPQLRSSLRMGALGENVGWGWALAAQHRALLAGPHHRANLEDPRSSRAGFAVVRTAHGRLWTTADFGQARH